MLKVINFDYTYASKRVKFYKMCNSDVKNYIENLKSDLNCLYFSLHQKGGLIHSCYFPQTHPNHLICKHYGLWQQSDVLK